MTDDAQARTAERRRGSRDGRNRAVSRVGPGIAAAAEAQADESAVYYRRRHGLVGARLHGRQARPHAQSRRAGRARTLLRQQPYGRADLHALAPGVHDRTVATPKWR